jgi:hypothetical protein
METHRAITATDVDKLLSKSERLAAMPTVVAPIRYQAIAYPFGDARSIRGGERRWRW